MYLRVKDQHIIKRVACSTEHYAHNKTKDEKFLIIIACSTTCFVGQAPHAKHKVFYTQEKEQKIDEQNDEQTEGGDTEIRRE